MQITLEVIEHDVLYCASYRIIQQPHTNSILELQSWLCSPTFTHKRQKDWVAKLDDDGLQDGITINEIEQFRRGQYKDADPNVQRKWCQVMLHFLPCVCPNYHKWDIMKSTPISQVLHATDEALVLWFLKCYIADWDKMYEETLRMQDVHEACKRRRKEGKHKSNAQRGEYLNLHASIKMASMRA